MTCPTCHDYGLVMNWPDAGTYTTAPLSDYSPPCAVEEPCPETEPCSCCGERVHELGPRGECLECSEDMFVKSVHGVLDVMMQRRRGRRDTMPAPAPVFAPVKALAGSFAGIERVAATAVSEVLCG